MQASTQGFQATIFNLRQLQGKELRKMQDAAATALGSVAHQAIWKNVSRRDYTLQQLEQMDHPYATRHGTIQIHPQAPYMIHTRSGKLRKSLDMKLVRRGGRAGGGAQTYARVGFINGPPRYATLVVNGTRIMLPRPVLVATATRHDVKLAMMRAVVTTLGKQMRTQAGIRFGGV